ncbi:MAG: HlyD family secretion protein [Parachlamydiaceae bacterium]
MNRIYFYVILGLATLSLLFIIFYKWQEASKSPHTPPPTLYPIAPYKSYITGVGIVEAGSENIFIGTPLNRIVEKVMVKVGSKIKKGEVLLQLEARDLEAELATRQVAYEIAVAKLDRLKSMPRQEDVISAEAALIASESDYEQAKTQYEMTQQLQDLRALSQEEINRRKTNMEQAEARRKEAQARLAKIRSGTWQPDLEIAELEVRQAQAEVQKVRTEIQRTLIRSPIDGKVLQIKIHEGEFPPLDTSKNPIMVVGNTDEKHLEVSINQFNAPYFKPDSPAVAFLQGDPKRAFELEFVSLDPYLVNKQDFTNDIQERVDTRVLKVTYRFKTNTRGVFVGQQMDVFIKDEVAL